MSTSARGPSSSAQRHLSSVNWRFLTPETTAPVVRQTPLSEEARQRIAMLEQALASSSGMDASIIAGLDGINPAAVAEWSGGNDAQAAGLSLQMAGLQMATGKESEIVPSDPPDAEPTPRGRPSAAGPGVAGGLRQSARSGGRRLPPSVSVVPDGGDLSACEDAELASLSANADADAAPAEEPPRPHSPSPVIIWRHAAPVRLATNVPAELLNEGAAAADSLGSARAARADPVGAPKAASTSRHEIRQQYGAWYLPVDQWSSRTAAGGQSAPERAGAESEGAESGARARKGKSEGREAALPEEEGWEEAEEELQGEHAELIPQLYSSKLYKEYLREKRIHRIPHYLGRVESPKTQQLPLSPSSQRASPTPQ